MILLLILSVDECKCFMILLLIIILSVDECKCFMILKLSFYRILDIFVGKPGGGYKEKSHIHIPVALFVHELILPAKILTPNYSTK